MKDELVKKLIKIRRTIHRHPEIAFDVHQTAALAAKEMENLGLKVKTGIGRTGVLADLEVPGATRTIALRADMDALPMDEENDCDFRSQIPGRAHMCGHDAHTAMLIGAASLLKQDSQRLRANVRFIFQPCEEAPPGGAIEMVRDGALEGVDEAYALHVWPWLSTGLVGVCEGPCMAQADNFSITIQGKGGHAAAPHQTVDPILVASQLVTLLQSIVARNVSPLDSVVISVTQIHGGSADNVIPESCELRGTVRTYSPSTKQWVVQRMKELSKGLASASGTLVKFDYLDGYIPVVNHPSACATVCKATEGLAQLQYPAERALFGEDFAYFAEKAPACFIQLGCRSPEKEYAFPLHHPRFEIDEDCLAIGAQLLARICYREI